MKRLTVLFLCITIACNLCACDIVIPPEVSKPQESTVVHEVPPNTIRKNGWLPEKKHDLTDAEIRHYVGVVLNAIIKLDIDTLRTYVAHERELAPLQSILNDSLTKAMWNKTIGQAVYLESTQQIAHRDAQYIFAVWYTDLYRNNITPPSSTETLTVEELTAIYDKYAANAPWVIDDVSPRSYEIDLQGGRIYFKISEMLMSAGYAHKLEGFAPSHFAFHGASYHLQYYVFGKDAGTLRPSFDFLFRDGNYENAQPLMYHKLGALIPYIDALTECNYNLDDNDAARHYRRYIKDGAMREKLQKLIRKNVQCAYNTHSFYYWTRINVDTHSACSQLTEEERTLLRDLPISTRNTVDGCCKDEDAFAPYCDIIASFVESRWINDNE